MTRLTVTPCGHLFCFYCITSCLTANGLCPTCRRNVRPDQLVEVKKPTAAPPALANDDISKKEELQQLTEKFGTKMAYLIFYLRYLYIDSPHSRVIVFSQWDKMLNMIGRTLEENGIPNVFIKGNVYVRNKAITAFMKQHRARVIMLSLEHAVSGTNLTEATHIVLMDPVAGSQAEAVSIEQQAIGRAHRMGQNKEVTSGISIFAVESVSVSVYLAAVTE